ncbi:MAG: Eco57I restriction-modification methylase domain-containing protein, partial [Thermomicrobiales bacterium]
MAKIRTPRAEWLTLIDIDGPFLDPGILKEAFPGGVVDWFRDRKQTRRDVIQAFEEWSEQGYSRSLQRPWFDIVFRDALEYRADRLLEGPAIPEALRVRSRESGLAIGPDLVLTGADGAPMLLIRTLPPEQRTNAARKDQPGAQRPVDEMIELLKRSGQAQLGLVTNGRVWSLVHAVEGTDVTSTIATWDAALWREEPITFDAFAALLEDHRFSGVAPDDTLPGLFTRSKDAPQLVTDQLGLQVRQAIEILVSAIDRANRERGGILLEGVTPETVY